MADEATGLDEILETVRRDAARSALEWKSLPAMKLHRPPAAQPPCAPLPAGPTSGISDASPGIKETRIWNILKGCNGRLRKTRRYDLLYTAIRNRVKRVLLFRRR